MSHVRGILRKETEFLLKCNFKLSISTWKGGNGSLILSKQKNLKCNRLTQWKICIYVSSYTWDEVFNFYKILRAIFNYSILYNGRESWHIEKIFEFSEGLINTLMPILL